MTPLHQVSMSIHPNYNTPVVILDWAEITLSRLSDALKSQEFVVTAELNPPKGTDLAMLYRHADALRRMATAFNVTAVSYTHLTLPTTPYV